MLKKLLIGLNIAVLLSVGSYFGYNQGKAWFDANYVLLTMDQAQDIVGQMLMLQSQLYACKKSL